MKNKLKNKKLLLMGGNAYSKGIAKYSLDNQIYLIAIGNIKETPLKRIADESYDIDTQDIDAIVKLVNEKNIDGIFVGASEENIMPAIIVSERTNARFYAKREQWEILSDKKKFKRIARSVGVPTPKEYSLTHDFLRKDLSKIEYPVIVKPVDGSGGKGMNGCYNEIELIDAYNFAMKCSVKKEVVVEEMIRDAKEVFFLYTIQNGVYSLSAAFTKKLVMCDDRRTILPIFHLYPSKHLEQYNEQINPKVQEMLKVIGVENGVITLQGFWDNSRFCFFEAGYRMGGAQWYIFTDFFNETNSLEYMINYVLTGEMADYDISKNENAKFKYPCCNYYISLCPGTIKEIKGLEIIEKYPQVLNITQMRDIGDIIEDNNSLNRVAFRLHVYGKSYSELADVLAKISNTVEILDDNGNEMQIEHLSYSRCFNTINEELLL